MKSLEQVNKMSLEDLLEIADDKTVEVPSDLCEDVHSVCLAEEIAGEIAPSGHGKSRIIPFAVPASIVAAAASLALFVTLYNPEPKDTFDDPVLAYAELERALSLIGKTASDGLSLYSTSVDKIGQRTSMVNSINLK